VKSEEEDRELRSSVPGTGWPLLEGLQGSVRRNILKELVDPTHSQQGKGFTQSPDFKELNTVATW
jgi:hypothetical protein